MKNAISQFVFVTVLLCLATAYDIFAQQGDEAAIKQIVQTMQDGWNKKDGKMFASHFAEEHDYVNVWGTVSAEGEPRRQREGSSRTVRRALQGSRRTISRREGPLSLAGHCGNAHSGPHTRKRQGRGQTPGRHHHRRPAKEVRQVGSSRVSEHARKPANLRTAAGQTIVFGDL